MTHQFFNLLICAYLFIFSTSHPVFSQKKTSPKRPKAINLQSIASQSKSFPGIFTIYQNKKTGKAYLIVKKEDLNKEFIYATYIENAPLLSQNFRGKYFKNFNFKIQRHFDKLEWTHLNNDFIFDPDSNLAKANNANISHSTFYTSKIMDENKKTGDLLIEISTLFTSEFFRKLSTRPSPLSKFKLGTLNAQKSKIIQIDNFPKNLNITATYSYQNTGIDFNAQFSGITDPRYVDIQLRHIILEAPQNDFKSRSYDYRVGYFSTQRNELTSTDYTPFKDIIHRWHLEKRNPDLPLSEVKTPIVWWIENTTPKHLIPAIKDGVLAWNKAFEAIGFKNALQVQIQAEDAKWKAGDIRYNVLRWTASPTPAFGGYGPSIVNPKTGQIIAADIMLEWIFLTNRIKYQELYLTDAQDHCQNQALKQDNLQLAKLSADLLENDDLVYEAVVDLIMHEVGHTLGLTHNFMASRMLSIKQLQDKALTQSKGLYASVMDYTPANIHSDPKKQGQYYATTVGPYDRWAIAYGYHPDEEKLDSILDAAMQPQHYYANDSEDMRSPGKGIDPRVMVNDLSSDPINYAKSQLNLVKELAPKLVQNSLNGKDNYEKYRGQSRILLRHYENQLSILSRFVGGVYSHRLTPDEKKPAFEAVPKAIQSNALALLDKYLFHEVAFDFINKTFAHQQEIRRGFSLRGKIQSPQPISLISALHYKTLSQLLHHNTLNRFQDSKFYGNTWSLASYLDQLNDYIFDESYFKESNPFKHALQITYTQRLIQLYAQNKYLYPSLRPTLKNTLTEIFNRNRQTFFLSKAKKSQRIYIQNLVKPYI